MQSVKAAPFAALASLLAWASLATAQAQDPIAVTFLPSGEIYNATHKTFIGVESNFVLKAMKVKNVSSDDVTLKRVTLDVVVGKRVAEQIVYPEESVASTMESFTRMVKGIRGDSSRILLGVDGFWDADLVSATPTLKPNQEAGFLCLHHSGPHRAPAEEFVVTLSYVHSGQEKAASP